MSWFRRHKQQEIIESDLDWENVEVHEGREVGAIYRATLATYNLQVFAPGERYNPIEGVPHVHSETDTDKRLLADLPAKLELAEEWIEDLLPDGYTVRITEWNK